MNKRFFIILFLIIFVIVSIMIFMSFGNHIVGKTIYDINQSIIDNDISAVKKKIKGVDLNNVYNGEFCDDGDEDDGEWYGCLSPLETASMYNRYEIAKLLVENGADVNYEDKYIHDTPLTILLRYNDSLDNDTYNIVKLLVKNGVKLNEVKDDFWGTPVQMLMMTEVKNKKQEKITLKILKLFLKNDASLDSTQLDYSLLHFAAINNNLEIVKYLVEEVKIDINLNTGSGYTPLIASIIPEHNDYKVAKYLIKKGADTTVKYNGKSALDYAKEKKNKELIELLS